MFFSNSMGLLLFGVVIKNGLGVVSMWLDHSGGA